VITEIFHYLICHSELQNFLIAPRMYTAEIYIPGDYLFGANNVGLSSLSELWKKRKVGHISLSMVSSNNASILYRF